MEIRIPAQLQRGLANAVVARNIVVTNDANGIAVGLTANDAGKGTITTLAPNGKTLVVLGSSDNGGLIYVYNKTGENITEMGADEYGNGLVGAWNREGVGRTLKPGP